MVACDHDCRVLIPLLLLTPSVQALNAEWLARGMKGYSGLLRVKDRDRLMVENADCLGPVPGIGNFRHSTSIGHFRFLKNLGYRDEFTRTYSQGGTLFSDSDISMNSGPATTPTLSNGSICNGARRTFIPP